MFERKTCDFTTTGELLITPERVETITPINPKTFLFGNPL